MPSEQKPEPEQAAAKRKGRHGADRADTAFAGEQ